MKIAVDISPIMNNATGGHKVRGAGRYIELLKDNLEKYSSHTFTFFTEKQKIDTDTHVIHYPYFEPFFLTLPHKNKISTVVTVHDLIPLKFPQHFPVGIKGKVKWHVQKNALKGMDAIVTDSLSSKTDIHKLATIDNNKICVVYLALSDEFRQITIDKAAKDELKKKYKLPDQFIIYVGDVTWNKNLPRIVQAVREVNIPLVMVGKTLLDPVVDSFHPWNKDLVEITRQIQNDPLFIRLGYVPIQDLVGLYNSATVCVCASLYEGFGFPLLEAMTCGCPVVSSEAGSQKEIAEGATLQIDPENVDSIVKGLKKVIESEQLQKELSKKGRNRARFFTMKKFIQQTVEVYEAVSK